MNKKCNSCVYQSTLGYSAKCCLYILHEGHSRGCDVDKCNKYKKGKSRKVVDPIAWWRSYEKD